MTIHMYACSAFTSIVYALIVGSYFISDLIDEETTQFPLTWAERPAARLAAPWSGQVDEKCSCVSYSSATWNAASFTRWREKISDPLPAHVQRAIRILDVASRHGERERNSACAISYARYTRQDRVHKMSAAASRACAHARPRLVDPVTRTLGVRTFI